MEKISLNEAPKKSGCGTDCLFCRKKIMAKIIFSVLFLCLFAGLFSFVNFALATNFNEQINYQGKLTDASDVPVPDGSLPMTFSFYSTLEGGSPLWTESQSVPVTNGLFSVMLGSVESLANVDFNQTLYLEVTINSDTLAPRKILGTVPAAFEAKMLNGFSDTDFAKLAADQTISGVWQFNNILNVSTSTDSAALTVLQTGSGVGVAVGDGNTTSTLAKNALVLGVDTTNPNGIFSIDSSGNVATSGTLNVYGDATFNSNVCIGGTCYNSWPSGGTNLSGGVAGTLAMWNSTNNITSTSLYFDNTTGKLIVAGATVGEEGPNLLDNPSFENWTNTDPDNWTVLTLGSDNYGQSSSYHSGASSVVISASDGPAPTVLVQGKNVTYDPSITYDVGFWAKRESNNVDAQMLILNNADPSSATEAWNYNLGQWVPWTINGNEDSPNLQCQINTDWSKCSFNGISQKKPTSPESGVIAMAIFGSSNGGVANIYFDDAFLNVAATQMVSELSNSEFSLGNGVFDIDSSGNVSSSVFHSWNTSDNLYTGLSVVNPNGSAELHVTGSGDPWNFGTLRLADSEVYDTGNMWSINFAKDYGLNFNFKNASGTAYTPLSLATSSVVVNSDLLINGALSDTSEQNKIYLGGYGPNVLIGGIASASSEASPAANAVDSDETTSWNSNDNDLPAWWKYDFGAGNAKVIDKFSVITKSDETINEFVFEGSNDDSNWATIGSGSLYDFKGWNDVAYFGNTTAYRYYRITVSSVHSGIHASISEIKMFEPVSGIDVYTNNAKRLSIDNEGTMTVNGNTNVNGVFNNSGKVNNPTHAGVLTDGSGNAPYLNGAYDVFVQGQYAYVAAYEGNALEVVDVSDPSTPTHVSSLLDGSGSAPYLNQPHSIYVAGKYAYLASTGNNALEVVDISNPTNPVHKGALTGISATDVYVSGKYAYVVGGNTLSIIDVSDPLNLFLARSISEGGNLTSVYISGKYAYLLDGNNGGSSALKIVDISDPLNPVDQGSITDGGGLAPYLTYSFSVVVSGKYAYVADYTYHALEVIDISNPAAPVHAGAYVFDGYHELNNVQVVGNYAYVTEFGGSAFDVFDISNPTVPVLVNSLTSGTDGANLNLAWGEFISGNYAYVAAYGGDALEIIDISGANISNAEIGSLKSGNLQVLNNAAIDQNLSIRGGLNVGGSSLFGDIYASGRFSGSVVTSDYGYFGNLQIGTSAISGYVLTTDQNGMASWALPGVSGLSGGVAGSLAVWDSGNNITSSTLYFDTNSSTMGIGTSTPESLLSIQGDNALTVYDSAGYRMLKLTSSSWSGTLDGQLLNIPEGSNNFLTLGDPNADKSTILELLNGAIFLDDVSRGGDHEKTVNIALGGGIGGMLVSNGTVSSSLTAAGLTTGGITLGGETITSWNDITGSGGYWAIDDNGYIGLTSSTATVAVHDLTSNTGLFKSSAAMAEAPELFSNPDFEETTTTQVLDGWQYYQDSAPQISNDASSGTVAALLSSAERQSLITQDFANIDPGVYSFSLAAKNLAGSNGLRVELDSEEGEVTYTYDFNLGDWITKTGNGSGATVNVTGDYVTYDLANFAMPTSTDFRLYIWANSNNSILVDNVQIRKDGTGDNIVQNGDMEVWNDWESPLDWNPQNNGGEDFESEHSIVFSGSSSVKLETTQDVIGMAAQQFSGLSSSSPGLITYKMRRGTGSQGVLVLFTTDEEGRSTSMYNFTGDHAGEWTAFSGGYPSADQMQLNNFSDDEWVSESANIITPSDGSNFEVIFASSLTEAGSIYLDDVSFKIADDSGSVAGAPLFEFRSNQTASSTWSSTSRVLSVTTNDGALEYMGLGGDGYLNLGVAGIGGGLKINNNGNLVTDSGLFKSTAEINPSNSNATNYFLNGSFEQRTPYYSIDDWTYKDKESISSSTDARFGSFSIFTNDGISQTISGLSSSDTYVLHFSAKNYSVSNANIEVTYSYITNDFSSYYYNFTGDHAGEWTLGEDDGEKPGVNQIQVYDTTNSWADFTAASTVRPPSSGVMTIYLEPTSIWDDSGVLIDDVALNRESDGYDIISNGGLENWSQVYSPNFWLEGNFNDSSYPSKFDSSSPYDGSYDINLSSDPYGLPQMIGQGAEGFTPGQPLTLTYYAKSGSGTSTFLFLVDTDSDTEQFYNFSGPSAGTWTNMSDGGEEVFNYGVLTQPITSDWSKYEVDITASATGSVWIYLGSPMGVLDADVFIDNVSLEENNSVGNPLFELRSNQTASSTWSSSSRVLSVTTNDGALEYMGLGGDGYLNLGVAGIGGGLKINNNGNLVTDSGLFKSTVDPSMIADSNNLYIDPDLEDWTPTNTIHAAVVDLPFDGSNPDLDQSGNDNNVTPYTDYSSSGGLNNSGAYDFNGIGGILQLSSNPVTGTSDFSIAMWIKTSAPGGSRYDLINWGNLSGGNTGAALYINSGTGVNFAPNSTDFGVYSASGGLNTGEWHLVGMTNDNGTVQIYVDGQPDGSPAYMPMDIADSGIPEIGRMNGSNYFSGTIDDVRIYNRALTPAEFSAMYGNGSGDYGLTDWRSGCMGDESDADKCGGGFLSRESSIVHSGNYAAKLTFANDSPYVMAQEISGLTTGQTMSCSYWARSGTASSTALFIASDVEDKDSAQYWNFYTHTWGPADQELAGQISGNQLTDEWAQYEISDFTVPASGKVAVFYLVAGNTSGENIYLDTFSCTAENSVATSNPLFELRSNQTASTTWSSTSRVLSITTNDGALEYMGLGGDGYLNLGVAGIGGGLKINSSGNLVTYSGLFKSTVDMNSATVDGNELFLDPGLEDWSLGDSLEYWYTDGSNQPLLEKSTDSRSGSFALHLIQGGGFNGNNGTGIITQTFTGLTPGQHLQLAGYAKTTTGGSGNLMVSFYYDDNGQKKWFNFTDGAPGTGGTWTSSNNGDWPDGSQQTSLGSLTDTYSSLSPGGILEIPASNLTLFIFNSNAGDIWVDDLSLINTDTVQDILQDGGFENWISTPVLNNWEGFDNSGTERETGIVHGGSYSVKLTSANNDVAGFSQFVSSSDSEMSFSLWSRKGTGQCSYLLLADSVGDENAYYYNFVSNSWEAASEGMPPAENLKTFSGADNTWVQDTQTVGSFPAGVDQVGIYVVSPLDGDGYYCYVDDLSVHSYSETESSPLFELRSNQTATSSWTANSRILSVTTNDGGVEYMGLGGDGYLNLGVADIGGGLKINNGGTLTVSGTSTLSNTVFGNLLLSNFRAMSDSGSLPSLVHVNLFINPSLETDVDSWNIGTGVYGGGTAEATAEPTSTAFQGKIALEINTNYDHSVGLMEQSVSTTPSTTYTVSFYASGADNGKDDTARLAIFDKTAEENGTCPNGSMYNFSSHDFECVNNIDDQIFINGNNFVWDNVLGNSYERYNYTFVASGTSTNFVFYAGGTEEHVGETVLFDSLQVEASSSATYFDDGSTFGDGNNLITSPSFEEPISGWEVTSTMNGQSGLGESTASLSTDSSVGSTALQLEAGNDGSQEVASQAISGLTEGENYTLSFYGKSEVSGQGTLVFVSASATSCSNGELYLYNFVSNNWECVAPQNGLPESDFISPTLFSNYTRYWDTFAATSTEVQINFLATRPSQPVIIDAVQLEAGDGPSAFQDSSSVGSYTAFDFRALDAYSTSTWDTNHNLFNFSDLNGLSLLSMKADGTLVIGGSSDSEHVAGSLNILDNNGDSLAVLGISDQFGSSTAVLSLGNDNAPGYLVLSGSTVTRSAGTLMLMDQTNSFPYLSTYFDMSQGHGGIILVGSSTAAIYGDNGFGLASGDYEEIIQGGGSDIFTVNESGDIRTLGSITIGQDSSAGSSLGPNIASNGDFQNWTDNSPDNWLVYNTGTGVVSKDSSDYAAMVSLPVDSSPSLIVQSLSFTNDGSTYDISVEAKSSSQYLGGFIMLLNSTNPGTATEIWNFSSGTWESYLDEGPPPSSDMIAFNMATGLNSNYTSFGTDGSTFKRPTAPSTGDAVLFIGAGSSSEGGGDMFYDNVNVSQYYPGDGTGSVFSVDSSGNMSASGTLNIFGNIGIGTSDLTHLVTLSGGAYSDGADWVNGSDRNIKENFVMLDPQDVLKKINQLSVMQWNYKSQASSTLHIGPVAQDFYALFGLGGSSTTISTIDPAGVALLGIQALASTTAKLEQQVSLLQGSASSTNIGISLQGGLNGGLSLNNLIVSDGSEFNGKFVVKGRVSFGTDSIGQAKILTGTTTVQIAFSEPYEFMPIITVTPMDMVAGTYGVSVVTSTLDDQLIYNAFNINLENIQDKDVIFNWHAFSSLPETKITVSDGTSLDLNVPLVIEEVPETTVPEISSPEEMTTSTVSSTEENLNLDNSTTTIDEVVSSEPTTGSEETTTTEEVLVTEDAASSTTP